MLRLPALLRISTELVVVLLGLLLVQVAISGRLFWNRRSPVWAALGAFLIYWGARAWWRARRVAPGWEERIRGGSLALVGVVMLGISRVPFLYVAPLLGVAGGILALRGLLSIMLIARSP